MYDFSPLTFHLYTHYVGCALDENLGGDTAYVTSYLEDDEQSNSYES